MLTPSEESYIDFLKINQKETIFSFHGLLILVYNENYTKLALMKNVGFESS